MMIRNIILVNRSTIVKDNEARQALSALQKQVARDFAPLWRIDCKLEFSTKPITNPAWEQLVLLDDADQADALGYHERTNSQTPIGFSFVKTTLHYGGAWSATTSHELLEMLSDPLINLTVQGTWKGKKAVFAFENCDAVENDEYVIDGVRLSNFVTPLWFVDDSPVPQAGSRFDFMKQLSQPFTLSKGGYINYWYEMDNWQQAFGRALPKYQMVPEPYSRRWRRVSDIYTKQFQAIG
jgi:hypothetical protein